MTTNDRNRILQADEMRPVFWDTDHWRDAARRIVKDAASQWRRVEPRARALRKEHVTALRVAFRLSPRLQAHLVASTKGRSRAALARSLSRLTMMGRVHGRLLAREGLDLRKVDDAAALSATLGSLLTALQGDDRPGSQTEAERAQAYLQRLFSGARQNGRFAFRNAPARTGATFAAGGRGHPPASRSLRSARRTRSVPAPPPDDRASLPHGPWDGGE